MFTIPICFCFSFFMGSNRGKPVCSRWTLNILLPRKWVLGSNSPLPAEDPFTTRFPCNHWALPHFPEFRVFTIHHPPFWKKVIVTKLWSWFYWLGAQAVWQVIQMSPILFILVRIHSKNGCMVLLCSWHTLLFRSNDPISLPLSTEAVFAIKIQTESSYCLWML